MKYLLTLSALACLISMLYSPSEVIERHNKQYLRKLNSARPLVGKQIQQVYSTGLPSDARLEARHRIASYRVAAKEEEELHNNTFTLTQQGQKLPLKTHVAPLHFQTVK